MSYTLKFLPSAIRDLESIDKVVGQRVLRKLGWLAENLDNLTPERLSGSLEGLFKLRVGSHRIIYHVLKEERVIIVTAIGHRSDIYRRS